MRRFRYAMVAMVAALAVMGTAAQAAAAAGGGVRIVTLSGRADLISGGEALVRIVLPAGADLASLKVRLGSRDVSRLFALREDGSIEGLVTGLAVGRTVLTALLPDGRGARLTIVDHPRGGPIFAGPQVQPWICTTLENGLGPAMDAQCDAPTKVSYLYQPTGSPAGSYKSYDPSKPPSDVATTTTDAGKKVPYIIRVEEGTFDRSIYKIYVLADPTKPWSATSPQQAWDRKLFIAFGGGCGTIHMQAPPTQQGTGFPYGPVEYAFGDPAADGEIQQPELISRGWMTAATGLNTLNQDCNTVVSAEAVMMLKQHIVDSYGTIGLGGSGGSIQVYNIAAGYPGLLDGIVPSQSFPDLPAMTEDTSDCYVLYHYFTLHSPELWLQPLQQLAVEGKSGPLSCGEFVGTFSDWFDPQNRGAFEAGPAVRFGCDLPPTQTYRPIVNPRGARCSVEDYQNAIWGHGGPTDAAPLPYDNVGVQYGLDALQRGLITPAQFVDLNRYVGGIDNEGNFTSSRSAMSETTARTMYRANQTTYAGGLADVPILDDRSVVNQSQAETLSDMHQPFYSLVTQARLLAANGTDANMVRWLAVPQNMDMDAALAMDRWLQAIANDKSELPRAEKIIRDKPRDLVNTCWVNSSPVTDAKACTQAYPGPANGGDARIAAGEGITDNIRKCQLKPLNRADYTVSFTAAEWKQLQAAFPAGVCDWTRPSVGYQPSIPWMTFADGPGGTPLGPAPQSSPLR
jgi:hypothetical protein